MALNISKITGVIYIFYTDIFLKHDMKVLTVLS